MDNSPDSGISIARVPGTVARVPDPQYITGAVEVHVNTPEDHEAVEGDYYDQLFIATGGSGVFGWNCTVNDSPCDLSGTDLHFEPYGTYQALIKGEPDAGDVGDLVFTITAYDVSDTSDNASITFEIEVLPEGSDDPDPEEPTDPSHQHIPT